MKYLIVLLWIASLLVVYFYRNDEVAIKETVSWKTDPRDSIKIDSLLVIASKKHEIEVRYLPPKILKLYDTIVKTDTTLSLDSSVSIQVSQFDANLSRGRDSVSLFITFFGAPLNAMDIKERWNRDYFREKVIMMNPKGFMHGISAGIGYGVVSKRPDFFIGYSWTYLW